MSNLLLLANQNLVSVLNKSKQKQQQQQFGMGDWAYFAAVKREESSAVQRNPRHPSPSQHEGKEQIEIGN